MKIAFKKRQYEGLKRQLLTIDPDIDADDLNSIIVIAKTMLDCELRLTRGNKYTYVTIRDGWVVGHYEKFCT